MVRGCHTAGHYSEEEEQEDAQTELQRRGIRRRRIQRVGVYNAIWCRQWRARRPLYGQYEQLLQELKYIVVETHFLDSKLYNL